jgi:hypothetical protein
MVYIDIAKQFRAYEKMTPAERQEELKRMAEESRIWTEQYLANLRRFEEVSRLANIVVNAAA